MFHAQGAADATVVLGSAAETGETGEAAVDAAVDAGAGVALGAGDGLAGHGTVDATLSAKSTVNLPVTVSNGEPVIGAAIDGNLQGRATVTADGARQQEDAPSTGGAANDVTTGGGAAGGVTTGGGAVGGVTTNGGGGEGVTAQGGAVAGATAGVPGTAASGFAVRADTATSRQATISVASTGITASGSSTSGSTTEVGSASRNALAETGVDVFALSALAALLLACGAVLTVRRRISPQA